MRMTLRPILDKNTTIELFSKDAIVLLRSNIISSTIANKLTIDDTLFPDYSDIEQLS
jgi:hypothetical protein